MRMLINYTSDGDALRLIAVYSDSFSLERKQDFKPMSRKESLEDVETFMQTSPLVFSQHFYTDVNSDLDEDSFTVRFATRLLLSIQEYGDDKTISALSMGKS